MVPELRPMDACEYLHLSYSGASRASQRTAIPDFCLQAHLGINYSLVSVAGWVPKWGNLQIAFPSVSAPFFGTCISFRQEQFWVQIFEMSGWPHPSTGVGGISIYCRWPLQVLPAPCWAFWLMSSPLCPLASRDLTLSSGFPSLPPFPTPTPSVT